MNRAANAYFQTKVNTTDQGQLLIMLYDGALRYLQQARDKMLANDYAGKGILISKVIDIVNELSASLNMEKGGDLAVNLNNLYLLCTARLLQANLKMSVESLDSVVNILTGLRGAYAQIIDNPEARRAAQDIAGRMQPPGSVRKVPQPMGQPQAAAAPRTHASAAYGRVMSQATAAAQAAQDAAAAEPAPQKAHVQNFVPPADIPSPRPGNARAAGAYGRMGAPN